jgi:hypothetical protein
MTAAVIDIIIEKVGKLLFLTILMKGEYTSFRAK